MGMFGSLTRTTEKWVPAALLCKRFNIRNPFPGEKPLSARERQVPHREDGASGMGG